MNSPTKFRSLLFAVVICIVFTACASRPVLLPGSAVAPAGIDLSGRWKLRVEPGAGPAIVKLPEPGVRIPPPGSSRVAGKRATSRASGGAVHIFLENGESLKISQTTTGLFISFDRAIVEEYTFGENRKVSVGPIEAQRVSGWRGDMFIVQTLDKEGLTLTETWRLADAGRVLLRSISITRGEAKKLSMEQRFDSI